MRAKVYRSFTARDGREFLLRPLGRGDLDALLAFANKMFRERKVNRDLGIVSMDRRITRADERRFLDGQLKGMKERRLVSVAAFHDGQLVGHCDVTGRRAKDEKHTGVLGIVIVEGYRGVGLGEQMIRTALDQSSKLGIWLVELTVFSTNARARRLYSRMGFMEAGLVPDKILRDGRFFDEVTMYTKLPHK